MWLFTFFTNRQNYLEIHITQVIFFTFLKRNHLVTSYHTNKYFNVVRQIFLPIYNFVIMKIL